MDACGKNAEIAVHLAKGLPAHVSRSGGYSCRQHRRVLGQNSRRAGVRVLCRPGWAALSAAAPRSPIRGCAGATAPSPSLDIAACLGPALSALQGQAWGRTVAVPFLTDIEVHIRLLLALPLLIATELVVHEGTRGVLGEFIRRGLVADSSRARLEAAISSALRLRNSVLAEVMLISGVYFIGTFYVWPRFIALSDVSTWRRRIAISSL